jgi:hypothetical protein
LFRPNGLPVFAKLNRVETTMNARTLTTDRPIRVPDRFQSRAIQLGLDFGTHSTKAMLRVRGNDQPLVLFLDEPTEGYPQFSSPSLVRLTNDGRLFFGAAALAERDGHLFRSLKIHLLPPSERSARQAMPPGTSPDLLVAAYLTWLLQRVRRDAGNVEATRFGLNVAAPMNHLEDVALRTRYQHVVHASWQAAFDANPVPVHQGVSLTGVQKHFSSLLAAQLPPAGMRRFNVLPETLAPLVSLSYARNFKAGFYMMIDMGAGTTEVSVSQLGRGAPGADRCIWCYADESFSFGGDDFQANDLSDASTYDRAKGEKRLRDRLLGHLRDVWKKGFEKDAYWTRSSREQWRQLMARLTGGGLRRKGLQDLIEGTPPQRDDFRGGCEYEVGWHYPFQPALGEPLQPASATDTLSSPAYLAVANGLAVQKGDWPDFKHPDDVKPLGRPEETYVPQWEYRYGE